MRQLRLLLVEAWRHWLIRRLLRSLPRDDAGDDLAAAILVYTRTQAAMLRAEVIARGRDIER